MSGAYGNRWTSGTWSIRPVGNLAGVWWSADGRPFARLVGSRDGALFCADCRASLRSAPTYGLHWVRGVICGEWVGYVVLPAW
jgi:hypothetical protein